MVSAVSCGIEKYQLDSASNLTFTILTDGFVMPRFSWKRMEGSGVLT